MSRQKMVSKTKMLDKRAEAGKIKYKLEISKKITEDSIHLLDALMSMSSN